MIFTRTAAILALTSAVTFGMAQTSSPASPSPTQGEGNQRGAGTSPGNSSNGGAGTTQPSTKKHKHHKKAAPPAGSNDTTPGGTSPAPPPAGTAPQR